MFLAEPTPTPYDLRFRLLGFHVRVAPWFWLAALILGKNLIEGIDRSSRSPGVAFLIVAWIGAVFLSILVHELGHAFAMRRYGIPSFIVLYHFGGLAISTGHSRRTRGWDQIFISAAGPGAQLALAALVMLVVQALGYSPPTPSLLSDFLPDSSNPSLPSIESWCLAYFLIEPSVDWALLNLLPVFPLDGGQIARQLFSLYGRGDSARQAYMLSLFVAGFVAIWAFANNDPYLALMFGMLGYSSYQALQGPRW